MKKLFLVLGTLVLSATAYAEEWICTYNKPIMNDYLSGTGKSEKDAMADLNVNLSKFDVKKASKSNVNCEKIGSITTSGKTSSSTGNGVVCSYEKPVMNDYMSADGDTEKEAIAELKRSLARFEVNEIDEDDINCKSR